MIIELKATETGPDFNTVIKYCFVGILRPQVKGLWFPPLQTKTKTKNRGAKDVIKNGHSNSILISPN